MTVAPNAAAPAAGSPRQMLTFHLGGETYGLDILRVKEIRGWSPVTKIPQSPAYVLGVLNLRGAIVPIVDLRTRFALEGAEYTPMTVIIVLSVEAPGGRRDVGVVVDGVSDVADLAAADLQPPPDFGNGVSTESILGLAHVADRMVIVLDVDALVADTLGTAMPRAANA